MSDPHVMKAWRLKRDGLPPAYQPVCRLLLQVGDLEPVDVCQAELYQDPRRLALLVEVALMVELKRLKEGPAYERVRRGQE